MACTPYWEHDKLKEKVQALEKKVERLEKKQEQDDEAVAERKKLLEFCVTVEADQEYWQYVKLNGNKVKGKIGVYTAPRWVWDEARKKKQDKIEECKLLYGR